MDLICETCDFFKGSGIRGLEATCHRNAPTNHGFSIAGPTEWCGQWKPRGWTEMLAKKYTDALSEDGSA